MGWSPLIVVCLAEYFNWIRERALALKLYRKKDNGHAEEEEKEKKKRRDRYERDGIVWARDQRKIERENKELRERERVAEARASQLFIV